jgi:hypothetical protein
MERTRLAGSLSTRQHRLELSAEPRLEIRIISPIDAERWLARKPANRNASKTAVDNYARAMKTGSWLLNGEAIIFDRTGILIDGLARLSACVTAKVPFVSVVVEGADPDITHTIDQQRRRSYKGVLESRGIPNAAATEGALVWLMRYKDRRMEARALPIPWARLDRILAANRGLAAAIQHSIGHPARVLNEAIRTPLTYMGYQVDVEKTDLFLDQLAYPNNHPPGAPGCVLFNRLDGERGRAAPIPRWEKFALAIKALNDVLRGKTSPYYRWVVGGKNAEPFPEVSGYAPENVRERGAPAVHVTEQAEALLKRAHGRNGVTWAIETITPQMADRYMTLNKSNRRIIKSHVDALVRDIKAGSFMLNYKGICFAEDGHLLNGQHRLRAVIEANSPIEALVLRNIDARAYETYDIQAKREVDIRDLVEAREFELKQVKAAAVLVWKDRHKDLPYGAKPTANEIRQLIDENPKLATFMAYGRQNRNLAPPAVLTYCAFKFDAQNHAAATEFLRKLANPAEMERGHPVMTLRQRLIKFREDERRRASRQTVLEHLLAGWERFLKYRREQSRAHA